MTPKERAAMKQALEALVRLTNWMNDRRMIVAGAEYEAITALREALAEQAEHGTKAGELYEMKTKLWEPLPTAPITGYYNVNGKQVWVEKGEPLYAAPVQQVDLTDDDLLEALKSVDSVTVRLPQGLKLFARAVIAAYKEKNK